MADRTYPLDLRAPERGGYVIVSSRGAWRWEWHELEAAGEDTGAFMDTKAEALRDAADDAEESIGHAYDGAKLARRLRQAATMIEKGETE